MSNTEEEKENGTEHDDGSDDEPFPLGNETGDLDGPEQTGLTTEGDRSQ